MTGAPVQARLALKNRSRDAAGAAAMELGRLGFDVRRVSERGVSFIGSPRLFESVFETKLTVSGSEYSFASDPTLPPGLADEVQSVYFPSKPTFFP